MRRGRVDWSPFTILTACGKKLCSCLADLALSLLYLFSCYCTLSLPKQICGCTQTPPTPAVRPPTPVSTMGVNLCNISCTEADAIIVLEIVRNVIRTLPPTTNTTSPHICHHFIFLPQFLDSLYQLGPPSRLSLAIPLQSIRLKRE